MSLEEFSSTIQRINDERRSKEQDWFIKNKPIKEFSLKNTNDDIETHYGVWDMEENWLLAYYHGDQLYSFQRSFNIAKNIVKELSSISSKNE